MLAADSELTGHLSARTENGLEELARLMVIRKEEARFGFEAAFVVGREQRREIEASGSLAGADARCRSSPACRTR